MHRNHRKSDRLARELRAASTRVRNLEVKERLLHCRFQLAVSELACEEDQRDLHVRCEMLENELKRLGHPKLLKEKPGLNDVDRIGGLLETTKKDIEIDKQRFLELMVAAQNPLDKPDEVQSVTSEELKRLQKELLNPACTTDKQGADCHVPFSVEVSADQIYVSIDRKDLDRLKVQEDVEDAQHLMQQLTVGERVKSECGSEKPCTILKMPGQRRDHSSKR